MLTEEQVRNAPAEDYMSDEMLQFFRARLLTMREEILERQARMSGELRSHETYSDPVDRASSENDNYLAHRLRDRETKLLQQIATALRLIRDKEYGYCEIDGSTIGVPRLLARPMATTAVEAKETRERRRSMYRAA